MYFALFERLRQFRECGLPMWIQLTHHVDPTFSQDNFDNSTILRAIHTLLCRSLNHALVVETVQQPGPAARMTVMFRSKFVCGRGWVARNWEKCNILLAGQTKGENNAVKHSFLDRTSTSLRYNY